MAEKDRARHAFGSSQNIEEAKQANKIDAFDILFLDGDSDPKIGWLDKSGNTVIVPNATEVKGQVAALETELATKVSAEEVDNKLSTKADASDVEALESQIAAKVDAATVQTMIEEHSDSLIEVVEF